MEMDAAQQYARELLESVGAAGWVIGESVSMTHLTSLVGDTKLLISKHVLPLNDRQALRQDVLHQVAHSMLAERGITGHGSEWRARLFKLGGFPIVNQPLILPIPKFVLICNSCHQGIAMANRRGPIAWKWHAGCGFPGYVRWERIVT